MRTTSLSRVACSGPRARRMVRLSILIPRNLPLLYCVRQMAPVRRQHRAAVRNKQLAEAKEARYSWAVSRRAVTRSAQPLFLLGGPGTWEDPDCAGSSPLLISLMSPAQHRPRGVSSDGMSLPPAGAPPRGPNARALVAGSLLLHPERMRRSVHGSGAPSKLVARVLRGRSLDYLEQSSRFANPYSVQGLQALSTPSSRVFS